MNRRIFVAAGLAVLGFGRRTWAQLADPQVPIRFAALTRPVRIPLSDVVTPWQPVPFVAEAMAPVPRAGAAETLSRRVLISGVLFRTETNLSALCVTCPHEQCQVDLVTDPARLSRMIGRPSIQPLFECGCHFSVFDAANEGARLSGESPRGLYRFRIAGADQGTVEINEVEEVAISEV
jgi:Rieske Fe-S protein